MDGIGRRAGGGLSTQDWHGCLPPLQDGDGTEFYGDTEEVLAKVPRRGIPMLLHETAAKTESVSQTNQA
jgi:hypothetical protein